MLLCAAVLGFGSAGPAVAQSVWELTPYRIRAALSLEYRPELTPPLEANLRTGLVDQANLHIGAAWELTVEAAPAPLGQEMLADLASIKIESLPAEWLDADKVTLLSVGIDLNGFQVSGRELDVRTRMWGPVVRATAPHPARLCDTLFSVLHRAFAPLAQIEEVEEGTVTLRLRAAELPPRDRVCLATAPGDVFQPIVRHNDRDGKPRHVAPIPWTYFQVKEAAKAELKCQLCTGIRSPLSGRRRGRVEQLALAVVPPGRPTRLVLHSRSDKNKPLVGYEVYRQLEDGKRTVSLGRTDRFGAIAIEPGEALLQMLVVKSGDEVLARLPIVLGLEPEVIAPVADDDQRLEAEGFVAGFQESLVDLVTHRELLQSQIRARLRAGDLKDAEAILTDLRKLKGRDDLMMDLNREKQKIFSSDAVVQRKIDKLFNDTQNLVRQYVDPTVIERLVGELRDARKAGAARPTEAAEPPAEGARS
jgi:hypothetical protein